MRVRVHPLALVMMALAAALGQAVPMAALVLSVTLHELGHVAAGRLCHAPVAELSLMPCGGAARFDNLWRLRRGPLCLVALAGPADNLALVLLNGSLVGWGAAPGPICALMARINLSLMLFNLLPALPLDGGRVLCVLLMERLSPARAVRIGILCGRALGVALCALGAASALRGPLNLAPVLTGAYLILSGGAERRAMAGTLLEETLSRERELREQGVLPLRHWAVTGETTLAQAACRLTPGYAHRFLLMGEDGSVRAEWGEKALSRELMRDGEATFSALAGADGK